MITHRLYLQIFKWGAWFPAFIYVREQELRKLKSPIRGWFSHEKPFEYSNEYNESNSIEKFSNGTPHILSLSTLKTSLDITIEATTEELNIKSAKLFDYFVSIYINKLKKLNFELLTPMDMSKEVHILQSVTKKHGEFQNV